MSDVTDRFRRLHRTGIFLMPNPWDAGSARYLASLGFPALATTSSGHAATLGRDDQAVTRDELLAHAEALAAAVEVPLNVDAERCFADDPAGVAAVVRLIGETGAAGCSIEDWNPETGQLDPMELAAERVAAAVDGARPAGMVVTARAENHLYGTDDLDDTLTRLVAYRNAGAEVVYAPGLTDLTQIRRVVDETATAVNVLALGGGPTVAELADAGVRRVSTGGALSRVAFGALERAARELRDSGTTGYLDGAISGAALVEAFRAGSPPSLR